MKDLHLYIYNEIGGFGVTEAEIREEINQAGEFNELFVHFNSPGGFVDVGTTIANIIRALKKPSTAIIEGFCGSIATRIALACDTVKIAPNAMFMIHFASVGVQGNKEDLGKAVKELSQIDEQLIKEYQSKTGISRDDLVSMMDEEKIMTGEEAVRLGFADELTENIKAVAKFEMKEETEKLTFLQKGMEKIINLLTKNESDEKYSTEDEKPSAIALTLEDGLNLFVFSEDGELEGKRIVLADEQGEPTDVPAPNGNHRLSDSIIITVEDGIVTAVSEEETENEMEDPEKEEMKAKIEALQAELAIKNKEEANFSNQIEELTNKFQEVESKIKNLADKTPIGEEYKQTTQIVSPNDKSVEQKTNSFSNLGSWGAAVLNKRN